MRQQQKWTSIILPKTGWMDIDLNETWQYRDLIKMFVRKDIVTYYKQTILGGAWFILNPLLTTTIFTIIFGVVANISTDGVPNFLFYMIGNTVWGFFSTSLTQTSNTFIRNARIMGKVYFPRLTVPISTVAFAGICFFVQFGVFLLIWIYYWTTGKITPNLLVLYTPLLLLHEGFLALGCGIIVSSLTTKYRDLQMLVQFGVNIWMYASPVVYSSSSIPTKYRYLFMCNPMAPILEMFRFAYFGAGNCNWTAYIISIVVTAIILSLGVILFSKVEKNFMDTI